MKRLSFILAAAAAAAYLILAARTVHEEANASAARLEFEKHMHTCEPGACIWEGQ
jgi:hypothetical protein